MAGLLEEVLREKKEIFALEHGNLPHAEYQRLWEQETRDLATLLSAPPTRHAKVQPGTHESQHVDSTGFPAGSNDSVCILA